MKTILKITALSAILLSLVGVLVSCGKEKEMPPSGWIDGHIHAKVENASEFSNVVEVKLMVFDGYDTTTFANGISITERHVELTRGEWKDDGFTIELPQALAPNHLRPLVGEVGGNHPTNINVAQSTANVSNRNVRIVDARFVGIDKDGRVAATFFLAGANTGWGGVDAFFTYVDSDVTISGNIRQEGHTIPASPDSPTWFEEITNYSIKWENGWNVWYRSRSSTVTGYILLITNQWATIPISGLKWHGSKISTN